MQGAACGSLGRKKPPSAALELGVLAPANPSPRAIAGSSSCRNSVARCALWAGQAITHDEEGCRSACAAPARSGGGGAAIYLCSSGALDPRLHIRRSGASACAPRGGGVQQASYAAEGGVKLRPSSGRGAGGSTCWRRLGRRRGAGRRGLPARRLALLLHAAAHASCPWLRARRESVAGSGRLSSWATACPPPRPTPGWRPTRWWWAMSTCLRRCAAARWLAWLAAAPSAGREASCECAHTSRALRAGRLLPRAAAAAAPRFCLGTTEGFTPSTPAACVLLNPASTHPPADLHLVWLRAAWRPQLSQGRRLHKRARQDRHPRRAVGARCFAVGGWRRRAGAGGWVQLRGRRPSSSTPDSQARPGHTSHTRAPPLSPARSSSPTGLPAATVIGRSVTIGQSCLLRSTTVQDEAVVGDKCVLLEGSLVEKHAVLAPGSVLPPGRRIPSGQLWAGSPAKYVRDLTKDEVGLGAGPGAAPAAA